MANELEQAAVPTPTLRPIQMVESPLPPMDDRAATLLAALARQGEHPPKPVEETFQHKVWLEEYREAGQYHRLHLQLMFAEMAVFLTATGLMLGRVTSGAAMPQAHKLAFCALGFALAVVFGLRHRVLYHQSGRTRARAIALQQPLNMTLYASRAGMKWWLVPIETASFPTYLMYWLVGAGWFIGALRVWGYLGFLGP